MPNRKNRSSGPWRRCARTAGECVVNNNKTGDAGFRWRRNDGTQAGGLLRDIAMALAVTLALALAGMIGAAHAQEHIVQISGAHRTAMVTVSIGKSRGCAHGPSFVDVTVGDPEVADVNPLTDHSLSILGKKIGTTRVSVYAEGKKLIGMFDVEVAYDTSRLPTEIRAPLPAAGSAGLGGQRPHHALRHRARRRHARQGGDRSRKQFGPRSSTRSR